MKETISNTRTIIIGNLVPLSDTPSDTPPNKAISTTRPTPYVPPTTPGTGHQHVHRKLQYVSYLRLQITQKLLHCDLDVYISTYLHYECVRASLSLDKSCKIRVVLSVCLLTSHESWKYFLLTWVKGQRSTPSTCRGEVPGTPPNSTFSPGFTPIYATFCGLEAQRRV